MVLAYNKPESLKLWSFILFVNIQTYDWSVLLLSGWQNESFVLWMYFVIIAYTYMLTT